MEQLYVKLPKSRSFRPATEAEVLSVGASIRGSRNKGNPKALTPEVVREIHRLRGLGLTWRKISEKTGISEVSVGRALKRDAE